MKVPCFFKFKVTLTNWLRFKTPAQQSAALLLSLAWILPLGEVRADGSPPLRLRIATYNLHYYAVRDTEGRPAKSGDSLHKTAEVIHSFGPDVLALQEIASPLALEHLQRQLSRRNLVLPYSHMTSGADTNIHLAVLSRFPITRHFDHSNEGFSLYNRYHPVLRSFLEVEIQLPSQYQFRLITAHLKSKRPVFYADESQIRLEEARILRSIIDRRLMDHPQINLAVLGDLNDFQNSKTVKLIRGGGKKALWDARPGEIPPAKLGAGFALPRPPVAWTHFYEAQDTYSRLDYLFLSAAMKREWIPEESYVFSEPIWSLASDHRPVIASFHPVDR